MELVYLRFSMKHFNLILTFIVFQHTVYAQDSLITMRDITSELTIKSSKTTEGFIYQYVPIRMQAGDKILALYTSNDFTSSLIIQDSLGDEVLKSRDKTTSFTTAYDMLYYITCTTKEQGKTGKFHLKLYHYHKKADAITDSSSFCKKLKGIIFHSQYNFQFITNSTKSLNQFEPSMRLGKDNIIYMTNGYNYTAIMENKGKPEADSMFGTMENDLKNCLPNYFYTREGKPDDYEITYKLEGNEQDDINATHTLMNVKAFVALKYLRSGNKYIVSLVVK